MAIETTKPTFAEELKGAIKHAIQKEIANEFEVLKKKMVEDLDYKKDQLVAGILLNVMSMVSMHSNERETVFTIRKVDNK